MKKNILIIFACTLISCASRKPIESTSIVEKTLIKDSTSITKVSEEIKDSLFVKITEATTGNKNIDSIVNSEIDKILSKIDTRKVSGSNELSFSYDRVRKTIQGYGKVAKSDNIKLQSNTFEKNNSTKVLKIPVKFIPKYVKILAFIGVFFLLLLLAFVIVWLFKKYKQVNSFL